MKKTILKDHSEGLVSFTHYLDEINLFEANLEGEFPDSALGIIANLEAITYLLDDFKINTGGFDFVPIDYSTTTEFDDVEKITDKLNAKLRVAINQIKDGIQTLREIGSHLDDLNEKYEIIDPDDEE
ncbi:hypothetical protein ATP_00399 [Candidatus Phytoplasma mali]|uniref:Uncharacterized protein n=1 Tax=Phytoplasma mali (strain AT) TaxID=482235 RepID=B3QZH9_PHYMT|nr:hypothetical protein [Candidatus Phytoplasma mali]CAP18586.1 hypothetical protein ATP_00399 [Candidatus Phytoplasma mali]